MDNIVKGGKILKRILLCCGAGMSSGFLAQNMRKSASKRNISFEIDAITGSDIESYIEDVDILLIAPHLTYAKDELIETAKQFNKPTLIIPEDIYGTLDGERLIDIVMQKI